MVSCREKPPPSHHPARGGYRNLLLSKFLPHTMTPQRNQITTYASAFLPSHPFVPELHKRSRVQSILFVLVLVLFLTRLREEGPEPTIAGSGLDHLRCRSESGSVRTLSCEPGKMGFPHPIWQEYLVNINITGARNAQRLGNPTRHRSACSRRPRYMRRPRATAYLWYRDMLLA